MQIKPELQQEYADYVKMNSDDPYSRAVVDYTEAWGDLMEKAIANGETVEECAKRTSHEADTDGITGFMYGCAASVISRFWIHGETLRRWHNLDTQIGNEGERANESGDVLNPAILNIG